MKTNNNHQQRALNTMNDQRFDIFMKEKLDAVDVPYDAGSWDLLAQRMDAPFSQEYPEAVADVDKAVFRNLQQLEAPFEPAHWAAMEQRPDKTKRTGRVLWLKLAEAAVFLILMAYLGGLLHVGTQRKAPTRATGPVAFLYERHEEGGANSTTEIAGMQRQNGVLLESLESPVRYAAAPAYAAGQLLPNLLNGYASESLAPLEQAAPVSAGIPTAVASVLLPLMSPERLEQTPLSAAGRSVANPIQPTPRTRHFYAFAMVAADRNQAVAGTYTHRSTGYSAGYGVGYRKQKWGIEAGALYANRSYDPKKSVTLFDGNLINGYYGSNLRTVEADILSVPVKATRRILKAGKAEVHAVAGASTHLALQKTYKYETIYFPGQSPSTLPVIPADQQQELRPGAKGLLEGGSLAGNAYLTADAGIRVEYPLSKRYTAFIEPTYRRAFGDGIGSKASKINTLALSAGVITTI